MPSNITTEEYEAIIRECEENDIVLDGNDLQELTLNNTIDGMDPRDWLDGMISN